MKILIEESVVRQALDALHRGRQQIIGVLVQQDQDQAITALRERLEQPEQDYEEKANLYMEMMDAAAKDADKAYALLRWAETEMRYAGWDKRVSDNQGRTDVYEAIEEAVGK